ncbi:SymE family type I addiction module toxin, partial [Salmonella enterica]|uniref:SymE family type I addiction module toxin n=1 Tax=Salmonella enterica TaxID=28901 RepID=UPI0035269E05
MNASGVSVRHINSETCMTACYSQIPSQHLKGDWQEEAGFETGHGVTVKISEGCLILIAETDEGKRLVRTVLIFTESSDQLS